ncbi:transposase, partial [Aeromonas caviae]
ERSHWSGNGVHVESELVFMIGRNMQHPRKNKTAINIEYMKASIRAKVEHPFRIIKRQFGFVKARYKGLLKNDNQLAMLFTLANLFRADQMIRQWERSH